MQQKAAVLLPAALVDELVGVAVLVQPVEALVQRKVGAELGKAGGAVLAAAAVFRRESRKTITPSGGKQDRWKLQRSWKDPPEEFSLL